MRPKGLTKQNIRSLVERRRRFQAKTRRTLRLLIRGHEEWFPRLAKRLKRTLWAMLIASAVVHAIVLILLGSLVVYRQVFEKQVTFEPVPEPERSLKPQEIEYTVRLQEEQRRSGRPRLVPRLSAQRIADFALPHVGATTPTPNATLVNSLKPFGQSGVGMGLGGGIGSGGLGLGTSTVRFFGITDHGERIAFLVDISLSMLEDDKGGEAGFEKLKQEIGDMISLLSPGTFFNLVLFGNGVDLFEQQMVLASDTNKGRAWSFLEPYLRGIAESGSRSGNVLNNYRPTVEGVPAAGGTTRMDLAIAAAFEQRADVLLLISDGRPSIIKRLEGKELARYQKMVEDAADEDAEEENAKRMAEFMREEAEAAAKRRARGLPPKVSESRRGPRLVGNEDGPPPPPRLDDEDIIDHIETLGKSLYKDKGHPMPRINCIAFVCERKDEDFMKRLARRFHGDFRRAKARVKPILEKD